MTTKAIDAPLLNEKPLAKGAQGKSDAVADADAPKNTVFGTALAIISTIMGGGIVSIPYAFAVAGLKVGISVQVVVVLAIFVSCILYLRTRTILRCNTQFSIIANECLGSVSGVVLNTLLVFAVFGILALYMILFSKIAISLLTTSNTPEDSLLFSKAFYIIILSLMISPIVIRKKVQELSFSTYVLFAGVIFLIVLLTSLLIKDGSYNSRVASGEETPASTSVSETTSTSVFESIMDSLNIAVASQGFVINLFPIYSDMKKSERPKMMRSVVGGLAFTLSTYTLLSVISIAYFGGENIRPSIFENLETHDTVASIAIRCLFLLIFFCNIPFVFLAGKTALMAIVGEFMPKPEDASQNTAAGEGDYITGDTEGVAFEKVSYEQADMKKADAVTSQSDNSYSRAPPSAPENFSSSEVSAVLVGQVRPEDRMPFWMYAVLCYSYLAVVSTAAIVIEDLTLIFGIIAGLAECSTVFILPSVFYLIAKHREDKAHREYDEAVARREEGLVAPKKKKGGSFVFTLFVYFYLLCGLAYFAISNYFNIVKIMK